MENSRSTMKTRSLATRTTPTTRRGKKEPPAPRSLPAAQGVSASRSGALDAAGVTDDASTEGGVRARGRSHSGRDPRRKRRPPGRTGKAGGGPPSSCGGRIKIGRRRSPTGPRKDVRAPRARWPSSRRGGARGATSGRLLEDFAKARTTPPRVCDCW